MPYNSIQKYYRGYNKNLCNRLRRTVVYGFIVCTSYFICAHTKFLNKFLSFFLLIKQRRAMINDVLYMISQTEN